MRLTRGDLRRLVESIINEEEADHGYEKNEYDD